MAKKIYSIIKTVAVCFFTISTLVGVFAFVLERFEPESEMHKPHGVYEKYLKRPLDVFLSMGALLVFSPVFLTIAILVRINIGSPVFFQQKRPGRDGNIFTMYKFRTMTNEKDEFGNFLSDEERLTPFGSRMRESSLDELPELINIIRGDMSIVGPRPLLVKYLSRYSKRQARRHEVRPGITGLAQVHGRNSISWEEKFEWDIEYVDRISFIGDVKILIDTIKTVLKHEGINAEGNATMEEFLGS